MDLAPGGPKRLPPCRRVRLCIDDVTRICTAPAEAGRLAPDPSAMTPDARGAPDREAHRRGPVIRVRPLERHRADILQRLGVRDRVALGRYAIRRGLVSP